MVSDGLSSRGFSLPYVLHPPFSSAQLVRKALIFFSLFVLGGKLQADDPKTRILILAEPLSRKRDSLQSSNHRVL